MNLYFLVEGRRTERTVYLVKFTIEDLNYQKEAVDTVIFYINIP